MLALASFVSYLLRSNLSIAAPSMMADLGLSEIQWGWVLAAFSVGYALFQIPGGVFGDHAGARIALTIAAVLWSVFMVVTAIIPGPDVASAGVVIGTLMAVRFLVGAAHAPIFPVINTVLSRWFPVGRWALPIGLSSAALTMGFAVAAPMLVWLVVEFGWRASFMLLAPSGLIVAALWWWYARDYPGEHRSVNNSEISLITEQRLPPALAPVPAIHWVRILRNRNVILLTLSYACMNFVFYEVFNWFYYYLVEVRSFDAHTAAYVTSTQWLAGGAGAVLGGWLCDRLCRRFGLRSGCRWPVVLGLIASAVLLLGGAYSPQPMMAVAMLALCFFFNQMTEGSYWAASIAVGGQVAGAAGGILNTGANVMGAFGALLVPYFANIAGWDIALASGAVFALVGALLMLFVRADETIEQ